MEVRRRSFAELIGHHADLDQFAGDGFEHDRRIDHVGLRLHRVDVVKWHDVPRFVVAAA
jgi:hypothetical protein